MTPTETLDIIYKRLDFVCALLIAWDCDRVQIDEDLVDGLWYLVEQIKNDLKPLTNLH